MMTLASAALLSVAAVGPVSADSACKGLEQAKCATATDCVWIDTYTRKKDGKEVAGHCKGKGKPPASGATDQAPAPTPKPTPQDTTPVPR